MHHIQVATTLLPNHTHSCQHSIIEAQLLPVASFLSPHLQGCIMRDLKPENIFWVEGSEPESDFCQLGDFGGFVIRGGVWAPSFTLTYVSPEEAKEFDKLMSRQPFNLTGASDLWKLGLTLVMALVGRLPEALTVMEDSSSSEGGSYDHYSFCESYCMNVVALAAERDYWDVWLEAQGITDPLLLDFLVRLLKGKPEERISMVDALHHPWVKGEVVRVQQLVEAYTPTWQQRRADAEKFLEEDEVVEQQQRQVEGPAVVGQPSVMVADASTSTSSSTSTASGCRPAQTVGTMTEVETAADMTSRLNSSEAASSQRTAADASTMTECEAAAQPSATSSCRAPMAEAGTMTEEERAAPDKIHSSFSTGTGAANTSKQGSTECTNVAAAAAVPPRSTMGSNTSTGGSRPSVAGVNLESTSQEDNSTDSSAMAATAFQETSAISPRSSSSQDSETMDALSTSLPGIGIKKSGSTAATAAGDVEEPATPPTAMSRAASAPAASCSPWQRSSRSSRYSSSADNFGNTNFNKASVRRSSSDTGGGSDGINNSTGAAAHTTLAVAMGNNRAGVAATEPSSAVGGGASISSGNSISSSSNDANSSSVTGVSASGAALPASSQYVSCGRPDSSNGTKFRYVRNKVTSHTKFQKVAMPCTCSAAVAVAGSSPKVHRRNKGDTKQVVVKEPAASSNKGGVLRLLGSLFCIG
jgi:serine/threonine protein kinase